MSPTPTANLALIQTFLNSLTGASANTIAAYRAGLTLFVEMGIELNESCLQQFDVQLNKRKFAKATCQLYITSLRRLLDYLDANEQLPAGFRRASAEAKLKAGLGKRGRSGYRHRVADPDLPRIVTFYDDEPEPMDDEKDGRRRRLELLRSRAIMHTLYASAGRVSEVASLTRAMVADGRASEVLITGKGNKQRMLLLTQEAQQKIREYCNAREDSFDALFISHRRGLGQPLSRVAIWQAVKKAAQVLGLSKITSPHSFRHFRATQLLNEGMPLESVQAYLGHSSPETTRKVYAHTHISVLRDQLNTYGLSPKEADKRKGKKE